MKEETKAAFRVALERHEAKKAEIERKRAHEMAKQEERAVAARKLRDEIVLGVLREIANDFLTPAGWHCTARSSSAGIGAVLEVYKGEMKSVSGRRPSISFALDSNTGRLTIAEATIKQDVLGEPLPISMLNADFVSTQVLRFFERLSGETVG